MQTLLQQLDHKINLFLGHYGSFPQPKLLLLTLTPLFLSPDLDVAPHFSLRSQERLRCTWLLATVSHRRHAVVSAAAQACWRALLQQSARAGNHLTSSSGKRGEPSCCKTLPKAEACFSHTFDCIFRTVSSHSTVLHSSEERVGSAG